MKGVNTEKAEKSFLCNRGKHVGIDIKDGKRPTRSIPSLGAQRRGSNQGTLAPAFSFTGENKSPTFFPSCPVQLKSSILSLSTSAAQGQQYPTPNPENYLLFAVYKVHLKYHYSLATSQWVCPVFRNPSISKKRLGKPAEGLLTLDEGPSPTRGWNAESCA